MGLDRTMPKKPPRHDIPLSWKIRVSAWLKEHHMTKKELAERVGTEPSTITRMLGSSTDKPSGSRYATKVAKVTGVPLPPPDADEEAAAAYERLLELRRKKPTEAQQIDALVRSLLGERTKIE